MDHRKDGARSISPHRGNQPPGTRPGIPGPAPGSLNILSTILRAPYPNQQQGGQGRGLPQESGMQPGRGLSPIRVITSLPPSGQGLAGSQRSGLSLSPSRTPTTLPPKKSMSPSRPIYTERQTPSPKVSRSSAESMGVSSYSVSSGRAGQSQLLSHLPRLEQALQGNLSHEGLFQQYKGSQVSGPPLHMVGGLLKEAAMIGSQDRRSPARLVNPQHGSQQPLPAHQRVPTPPHVTTIRRTPSPAHMPVVSEGTAKVIVAHTGLSRSQPVNLIKTHAQASELRLSDSDYKPGDLLQSINRSHETIQSHLMQGGLSPITPADPVTTRPWSSQTAPQLIQVSYTPSQTVSLGQTTTSRGFSQSHITLPTMSRTLAATIPALTPVSQAVGFTPVVLPTQNRQSKSPHGLSSALNSIGISSAMIHSQPSSNYMQSLAMSAQSVSMTEPGPPNVTISTCGSIPSQDRPTQKLPRNPFTFPATPPVALTNERPLIGVGISVIQPKLEAETKNSGEKHRHRSDEMPKLSPVKKEEFKEEDGDDYITIPNAYNMRMQTLANFPNNPTYRPTYRATSVAIHKAKQGCITNSAKSLDILRQNLQKSINKEIDAVIQSYLDKYFKIGIENIRLNNGDNAVTDDHIQAVCRQILEEAKKMYICERSGRQSISPARELSDNISETGSSGRRSVQGKRRHPSDTDSEASMRPASSIGKKKKGKYIVNLTGRSTPSKLAMQQSKREGPKYDPERLTEDTMFVMGSKANKAMGFGATRGRLYMKHPELFKYGGDQDDKTWLYEHQHMPATGGKSYLIILDDVRDLALNDEYRDAPGITVESLSGFTVPMWMIEKMRIQMQAMRTDLPKMGKYRSRSTTPNEPAYVTGEIHDEDSCSPASTKAAKDLPFSSFSSPKQPPGLMEASPADEELDFLSNTGNSNTPSQMSPFNMTGGFDDTSQSEADLLDEETSGKFGY